MLRAEGFFRTTHAWQMGRCRITGIAVVQPTQSDAADQETDMRCLVNENCSFLIGYSAVDPKALPVIPFSFATTEFPVS